MADQIDSKAAISKSDRQENSILNNSKRRGAIVAALAATTLFCLTLAIWLHFDKHIPASDEANHVLNGISYADLLQHARPLRAKWWHQFFTVNTYYPPVGTLAMGISLTILRNSIVALQVVKLLWLAVLSLSVGFLAFALAESVTAVFLAICIVNCCIIVCDFSHSSLIDQPLVSMVAAGLAAIVWKSGSDSAKKSITTGLVLGFAIMTKQVAIAFLGIPILFDLIYTFKKNGFKKGLRSTLMLLVPLATICLPWTLLNFQAMQQLNSEIASELAKRGTTAERIKFNVGYYLESWNYCASPLILVSSLIGFAALSQKQHQRLAIIWAAMLPAALALCLISCQPARDRYVAPIVILMALYSGIGLAQLKRRSSTAFVICLAVLAPLCTLQFISFNFCPYPIATPKWILTLAPSLQCMLREHVSPFFERDENIVYADHIAPNNEGGRLAIQILDRIAAHDSKLTSWLNITALSGGLDVHEMELLAKLRGLSIKPTTSRIWTALGDKVAFSESAALNYRWYLIKEGDQGFRFADSASLEAHQKLIDFVKDKYRQIETYKSLDGTQLSLYCAK